MVAIAFEASNILEKQVKAAIISKMCEELAPMVVMHPGFGGTRKIDMLVGDPLPRICEVDWNE
jgi:hydrogenase maturation factor